MVEMGGLWVALMDVSYLFAGFPHTDSVTTTRV